MFHLSNLRKRSFLLWSIRTMTKSPRLGHITKLLFKKQDPFELSHLQSPYDKHYNGPSREDTVCISFLQSSRHNSTVSQLNNLHSVNLQSPRSENIPSTSRQLVERRNMFLDNCHKLFQCKPKENDRPIPIDDMTNLGNGIELQPSNSNM